MDALRWFALIMSSLCFGIGLAMKAQPGRRLIWLAMGLLWPLTLIAGGFLYLVDGFKFVRARLQ